MRNLPLGHTWSRLISGHCVFVHIISVNIDRVFAFASPLLKIFLLTTTNDRIVRHHLGITPLNRTLSELRDHGGGEGEDYPENAAMGAYRI